LVTVGEPRIEQFRPEKGSGHSIRLQASQLATPPPRGIRDLLDDLVLRQALTETGIDEFLDGRNVQTVPENT
jgi:hypothetical protein